ncbi:MAG: hypothetical protein AABZ39_18160 [Spirochaetota bacterium]
MDKDTAAAIDKAHAAMWSRMIKDDGIMLDFTDRDGAVVIPTPEECAEAKPNAMGWWTPIENGGFFNGLYLPAVCERYRRTKSDTDKAHARALAKGLMLLASVSDVPGYIARGVATDGKSHYPSGSDDQTHPWFYGLYFYAKSGIPDAAEREGIIKKMNEVARALKANRWMCPCDGIFTGQNRGAFSGKGFRDASRLLFILRAMYELTRDESWLADYRSAVTETPRGSKVDRSAICAEGAERDLDHIKDLLTQMWIVAGSQGSLAELIRLESDAALRRAYREGMVKTALYAAASIAAYKGFDNGDEPPFRFHAWREMLNPNYKPQANQDEATKVAIAQLRAVNIIDRTNQLVPRRDMENAQLRSPLSAAFVVALCDDEEVRKNWRPAIEAAILHYEYAKVYGSLFFFAECAYYALP